MYARHVSGRIRMATATHGPFEPVRPVVRFGPSMACSRCVAEDTIPDYLTSAVSRRNAWLAFYREHQDCYEPDRPSVAWTAKQWKTRYHQAWVACHDANLGADITARQLGAWLRVPIDNAVELLAYVKRRKGCV